MVCVKMCLFMRIRWLMSVPLLTDLMKLIYAAVTYALAAGSESTKVLPESHFIVQSFLNSTVSTLPLFWGVWIICTYMRFILLTFC